MALLTAQPDYLQIIWHLRCSILHGDVWACEGSHVQQREKVKFQGSKKRNVAYAIIYLSIRRISPSRLTAVARTFLKSNSEVKLSYDRQLFLDSCQLHFCCWPGLNCLQQKLWKSTKTFDRITEHLFIFITFLDSFHFLYFPWNLLLSHIVLYIIFTKGRLSYKTF